MHTTLQGNHLDGTSGTLARAEATGTSVLHGYAGLTVPYGVAHLDGGALLDCDGQYGTCGAHLRATVALWAAVATLVAHLRLHQAVQLLAGAQHIVGAAVHAELAGGAVGLQVAGRERARRRDPLLPLGSLLVDNLSETAVRRLVVRYLFRAFLLLLGAQHADTHQQGSRGKGGTSSLVYCLVLLRLLCLLHLLHLLFRGSQGLQVHVGVVQSVLVAQLQTVSADHTTAVVYLLPTLHVDGGSLAVALTLAAADALLLVDDRLQPSVAREQTQQGSHRADGVAPRPAASPCQHGYHSPYHHHDAQRQTTLQPHVHLIESIAAIVLSQLSQQVVAPFVEGSHHTAHDTSVGTVGSHQRHQPSQVQRQGETRGSQHAVSQRVLRRAVAVLVLLAAQPGNGILHHPQGADDRAVDTSEEQRQAHDEDQGTHVHRQQGRQQLDFRHPPQVGMGSASKVHQQPCDKHPEEDSQRNTNLFQHNSIRVEKLKFQIGHIHEYLYKINN